MESLWRVACVRIPRFPIGAVFNDRARRHPEATEPRVILHHAPRATRHALPIESSLASDFGRASRTASAATPARRAAGVNAGTLG
jgi:hypothetical protein